MNERSVTRSAVILCLSQGAVSSSLKRLREVFNDELFTRTPQGMVPTHLAIELAPKVSAALNAISAISPHPESFDPMLSTRVFKIALSDDLEALLSKIIIKELTEKNLSITFSFYQTNSKFWMQTLEQHHCDLVICSEPQMTNNNYTHQILFSSSYSCLFDPRIHGTDHLSKVQYLDGDHIRVSYDARRGFIDDIFESENKHRNVKLSFTHFSGAMTAIINTHVIATIPTFAAKYYASITELSTCPVPLHVPSYRVFMGWAVSSSNDAEILWLKKFIADLIDQFIK